MCMCMYMYMYMYMYIYNKKNVWMCIINIFIFICIYIYRSRFNRIFSLTTTRSRRNLFVACKIVCLILYTIWLNGIATNNPNKLVFAIYFWRIGPPVWQQYGSTSLSGILVCIDCSAGRHARHLAFGISAAVLESTLAFCAEFLGRPWCNPNFLF
jgi:hypothetical protein